MLELAILGFLKEQSMHGYELKHRLGYLFGHVRPISDGALYPAIQRLQKQGLLTKRTESNASGMNRQVLSLTPAGDERLLEMLRDPNEVDISDRNRYFTILAFLKYLPKEDQCMILQRRLKFLDEGKSFFSSGEKPVKLSQEPDPFRRGMLHIAKETSRVERTWLRERIQELEGGTAPS